MNSLFYIKHQYFTSLFAKSFVYAPKFDYLVNRCSFEISLRFSNSRII